MPDGSNRYYVPPLWPTLTFLCVSGLFDLQGQFRANGGGIVKVASAGSGPCGFGDREGFRMVMRPEIVEARGGHDLAAGIEGKRDRDRTTPV